jgi:hypothetical protein
MQPRLGGLVPLNELPQELRQLAVMIGAALPQLARDVFRSVLRPALGGIESNDAKRATRPAKALSTLTVAIF